MNWSDEHQETLRSMRKVVPGRKGKGRESHAPKANTRNLITRSHPQELFCPPSTQAVKPQHHLETENLSSHRLSIEPGNRVLRILRKFLVLLLMTADGLDGIYKRTPSISLCNFLPLLPSCNSVLSKCATQKMWARWNIGLTSWGSPRVFMEHRMLVLRWPAPTTLPQRWCHRADEWLVQGHVAITDRNKI